MPATAFGGGAIIPEAAFDAPLSSVGAPASEGAPVKIRKNFPETWLWESLDSGYEMKAKTIMSLSLSLSYY